jgi:hypothetical protein
MPAIFSFNENTGDKIVRSLMLLKSKSPKMGEKWVKDSANEFYQQLLHNLETQGRGGQGPALAESTIARYKASGGSLPDGSGIRNHIQVRFTRTSRGFNAVVGIPNGDPTMVAIVQNYGCVIQSGNKSFYVPARYFWTLATDHIVRYSKRKILVYSNKL